MSITLIVVILIIAAVLLLLILRARRSRRSRSAATPGTAKQIYVGNLSYQVTEKDLKDHFSQYGQVAQTRIIKHHGSGRSKGFGFVTYENAKYANQALVAHGQQYQGRAIVVRIAKPR